MTKLNFAVFIGSGISLNIKPIYDSDGELDEYSMEEKYGEIIRKEFIKLLENPEWYPCFEFKDHYIYELLSDN